MSKQSTIILLSLLSCFSLYAQDRIVGPYPHPGGPSRGPAFPAESSNPYRGGDASVTECETDHYMPQRFIRELMRNSGQFRVEFTNEQKTQVTIIFPPYIDLCLNNVQVEPELVHNNLHIKVKMDKTHTEYMECLQNGGHVNSNGEFTSPNSFR